MELVVYGSFNCPYSYLASLRADRLAQLAKARVDWRAVVHDADVPPGGKLVTGDMADMFDRELEEIRCLLTPGEEFPASRPVVQPNTTAAVAGYSAVEPDQAARLRQRLFSGMWADGVDIGDRSVLDRLGCPRVDPGGQMREWDAEWKSMDRRLVPMMVLPHGEVSRGLGALARLAEMLGSTVAVPEGGEKDSARPR